MKVIIQRCLEASVSVNNEMIGKIDRGMVILVGFTEGDNLDVLTFMCKKILNLRIFDDKEGIMNKSILDIEGSILSISQFTLYANTSKGNRPSYMEAMDASKANKLYEEFNNILKRSVLVETGIFGSDMKVSLINDGPVTIILER